MVVEDHDGGDHAGGDHEHDAVEIGSCNFLCIWSSWCKLLNRHNMQRATKEKLGLHLENLFTLLFLENGIYPLPKIDLD